MYIKRISQRVHVGDWIRWSVSLWSLGNWGNERRGRQSGMDLSDGRNRSGI